MDGAVGVTDGRGRLVECVTTGWNGVRLGTAGFSDELGLDGSGVDVLLGPGPGTDVDGGGCEATGIDSPATVELALAVIIVMELGTGVDTS